MGTNQTQTEVKEIATLVAERGWKGNFTLQTGEKILGAFVTASDFDKGAVVVEKIGERHLEPRLIWLKDLVRVDAIWE